MEGHWNVLSEGEHLGIFVDARSRGMGGPFLVPIIERSSSHPEVMHGLDCLQL